MQPERWPAQELIVRSGQKAAKKPVVKETIGKRHRQDQNRLNGQQKEQPPADTVSYAGVLQNKHQKRGGQNTRPDEHQAEPEQWHAFGLGNQVRRGRPQKLYRKKQCPPTVTHHHQGDGPGGRNLAPGPSITGQKER